MNHKKSLIACIALLLPFVAIQDAHAYLDPATGSMILQIILGFFLAAGMTIKMYWHKLKGLFSKNKESEEEQVATQSVDELVAPESVAANVEEVKPQG